MSTAILWFRRDLRLADNPALHAALAGGGQLIPLYIHAPQEEVPWQPGAASRWWLHHSLESLSRDLAALGSRLIIRRGDSRAVLAELAAETGADALHWNRLYEPAIVARDGTIESWAKQAGLAATGHNSALLAEPWEIATGQGDPYRVFTPFHRACLRRAEPGMPLAAPDRLPPVPPTLSGLSVDDLELLPAIRWDAGLAEHWQPGEAGAAKRLTSFRHETLVGYADQRDRPDRPGTSRLSPHLHFGELGPRQLYWACRQAGEVADPWLRQLYWREFAHHLLYHYPHTVDRPLDARFSHFPWAEGHEARLAAWRQGLTGIPIVDAGMRELWHTGWMHNRVRMLAASLLTKNLLIPWQVGARWFWDTLVDANLANNTLGWQWTAGCGADAAPYFRIFNPVLQSRKFDPHGTYLKRWLPELRSLPDRCLHAPWEAPANVLDAAGIASDSPYRRPLVDLKTSRQQALSIWNELKRR